MTECEQVIGGTPEVCVQVCTTILSIFDGDRLIDETSRTSNEKCPGWSQAYEPIHESQKGSTKKSSKSEKEISKKSSSKKKHSKEKLGVRSQST